MLVESSTMRSSEETEWDVYGDDMYTIPGLEPVQPELEIVRPSSLTAIVLPLDKADEERRIKALVETPALNWQREMHDANGYQRGFGRRIGGRWAKSRNYGQGGLGSRTPPPGYVCYRCNEPGHFIQHCSTNGDSNYDIKRVKPPTGVPRSMLIANPEGSYVLPSGDVAILKPDEGAFEKEIEGLPTTCHVRDLPPELHCPLCKQVMRNAVLTSKCCFSSFCDKCISDYIISKSICYCGASKILLDDLLPNITLRETINYWESSSSSSETYGSLGQIQDIESARHVLPKAPSSILSATSMDKEKQLHIEDSLCMKEGGSTSEHKVVNAVITSLENVTTASRRIELSDKTPESAHHVQIKAPSLTLLSTSKDEDKQSIRDSPYMKEGESVSKEKTDCTMMHSFENETTKSRVDVLEKTTELVSSKETMSQEGGLLLEEVQEKMQGGRQGNKKKNKRHLHADMLSGVFSDLGNGNCAGMPLSLSAYNSYWTAGGTPWISHGCKMPLFGAMPYMGYTPSIYGIPLEGIYPQYSLGPQGYKLSAAPQRDLAELGIKSWTPTQGPLVMNTEESEAGKSDMRKKHKINQLNERDYSSDREIGREWCSRADASSLKSNPRPLSQSSDMKVASWGHHGESKTDYHDHNHQHSNRKLKTTASSNRDESDNKRKLSELPYRSSENHSSHRPKTNNFQDDHKLTKSTESSEEYHFKRRPPWSRDECEDGRRHSGHWRERESS